MSVQAITSVIERSELRGTARLVLVALANRDGDDGICPSIDRVAKDCRMSRRAVQEAIKRAREAEELHIEPNAGPHGTNRYWLHIDVRGCRYPRCEEDFGLCSDAGAESAPVQVSGGKLHPNPRNERTSPPESSENPSGSPRSHAPQGASDPPDRLDASFGEFWQVYPRKVGKRAARAAFERAARRASVEEILDGARRFAADPNLPETRFIPHPTTWLNQDRWADEPLPPRTDGRRGDPGGRNRAFALLEEAARLREQRLGRAGDRSAPPAQLASGGAP
jgi:hypothetical protein